MSFKERFHNPTSNPTSGEACRDVRAITMPARPRGAGTATETSITPAKAVPVRDVETEMRLEIRSWGAKNLRAKRRMVDLVLVIGASALVGYFTNWAFASSVLVGLLESAGRLAVQALVAGASVALVLWLKLAAGKASFKRHRSVRLWSKSVLYGAVLIATAWTWATGGYEGLLLVVNGHGWALGAGLWALVAAGLGGFIATQSLEIVLAKLLPRHWQN